MHPQLNKLDQLSAADWDAREARHRVLREKGLTSPYLEFFNIDPRTRAADPARKPSREAGRR